MALSAHNLHLRRAPIEILQINIGKRCNQTCVHCHVNAGPARREAMVFETMQRILCWLDDTSIETIDITGGAPELNPHFRWFVEQLRTRNAACKIIDRCNLTILFEPGQENLAHFLAAHRIHVVASLPCYSAKNVDGQRGDAVFERSIRALQLLNSCGYGIEENLPLHLVYNPNGDFLPGRQQDLEAAYKAKLQDNYGIVFNHLFTITNMPIARFATWLRQMGRLEQYQQLLIEAFNPAALDGLMCRNTINVDWQGRLYDCDFNQMSNLPASGSPTYLWDKTLEEIERWTITTADHCFGCTAGAGSSCGGALT